MTYFYTMKKYFYTIVLFILCTVTYSQISFNNTLPNNNTIVHISEQDGNGITVPKGILLPRLTQNEIDGLTYVDPLAPLKVVKLTAAEDGLLVFNTTTKCYNFWNTKDQSWKTICTKSGAPDDLESDLGLAEFDLDCTTVNVEGNYMINQPLDADLSNYLIIPITVTKPGKYTFVAATTNGFGYVSSGLFTTKGNFTIKVLGQGTPTTEGNFAIDFTINTTKLACTSTVQVLGPTTIGNKLKITRKMKVLALGNWGPFDSNSLSNNYNQGTGIMRSAINFGKLSNSVVDYVGWEEMNLMTNTTDLNSSMYTKQGNMTNIKEMLTKTPTTPAYDIVIIHTNFGFGTDAKFDGVIKFYADLLDEYLTNGGVVLMYSGSPRSLRFNNIVFEKVFGANPGTYNLTKANTVNRSAQGYPLNIDSSINIKGPFGDLGGSHWLPSQEETTNNHFGYYYNNLPANQILALSNDGNPTHITSFQHKTKHLFWVGDGYFFGGYGINKDVRNSYPLSKALAAGRAYNSPYFANNIAWALLMAQTSGINTR